MQRKLQPVLLFEGGKKKTLLHLETSQKVNDEIKKEPRIQKGAISLIQEQPRIKPNE